MAQILTERPFVAKKSLLTSMLGDKGRSLVASPVPQFDQHSLASSPPKMVEEQLDHVLNTWERAWTGVDSCSSGGHTSSCSGTPSGTSPQAPVSPGNTWLQPPTAAKASINSHAIAVGDSIEKAMFKAMLATAPHSHHVSTTSGRQGGDDALMRPDGDAAPLALHRGGATPPPSSRPATAAPINMHSPVIPNNAKDSTDFASVFFSPLPYSYLDITRSDSAEQILAQSVGSPDVTLRGGRLASTTALTTSESVSPNSSSAFGSHPLSLALSGSRSSVSPPREDVTSHGCKRGSPLRTSHVSGGGAAAVALGLVPPPADEPAVTVTAITTAEVHIEAEKVRSDTLSPDSVLISSTLETAASTTSASSISCDGTKPATSAARCTGNITIVRPPSHASLLEPSIVRSYGSYGAYGPYGSIARPGSPMGIPQFSSHPAVGSLVSAAGCCSCPDVSMVLQTSASVVSMAESTTRMCDQECGANLRMVAAAAMIPHVDKAGKGGEDAYCIVPMGLGAIGVADGVSGWAEEGIDPAEYSRTLMRFCASALHEAAGHADPREVIRYAHNATVMPGSSTVSLAVLKPEGRLEVANLGDSGVRVVRNGQIVFASTAQQHMFNMPFQLSHPSIIESPDDADSADVTTLQVQPGDIIVLATDGLYDNMFDDELASICSEAQARQYRSFASASGDAPPSPKSVAKAAQVAHRVFTERDASALAHRIARTAHQYAQNPYQRTPWSVSSCEQGMAWARFFAKGGGKMDDCTVIVAFVQATD